MRGFKFTERVGLQFRAELFHVFNYVNLQPPGGTTLGVNIFGIINAAERAQIIQFGLKLYLKALGIPQPLSSTRSIIRISSSIRTAGTIC